MEAFAKSDDERDFYLDRQEGFMVFLDLDNGEDEIQGLEAELAAHPERYCLVPKLTFYETKKIMEGFVNEKVYDIDTKEKLLDIIQSKEARENFLEFIYDHHAELEKWQQYYQERSRIRIIEWLRQIGLVFVFEEDLDLTKNVVEKLKKMVFEESVPKDVANARKVLSSKAKTYYSNEALNPRPKRGRPPKQQAKVEIEPQVTLDHYQTVPNTVRPFLFNPDISHASAVTFSAKFDSKEELLASLKNNGPSEHEQTLESLNQRLASLRRLSRKISGEPEPAADESDDGDEVALHEALRANDDNDDEDDLFMPRRDEPEEEPEAPAARKKPIAAKRRPAKTKEVTEAPKKRGRPPKAVEKETTGTTKAKRRIIPKKPAK